MTRSATSGNAEGDGRWVASTLVKQTGRLSGFGDTAAVIALDEHGNEQGYSHAELADRAFGLAGGLALAGIGAGDRVAVFAANSPDWVAVCLGVMCCGAAIIPLDATLSGEALARLIDDSQCRAVFAGPDQLKPLRDCGLDRTLDVYVLGDGLGAPSWTALLSDRPVPAPATDPEPDRPCALFFTSGTTGTPKGVPLSHANIMANLAGLLVGEVTKPGDRVLLPLPLHHVYPFTVGMLAPLAVGATVVFPAGIGAAEIAAALRDAEISVLIGVPRLHAAIADAVEAGITRRGGATGAPARAAFGISSFLRRRAGWRWPGRVLFRGLRARIAPRLRIIASGGARLEPAVAWTLEALGWQVLTGYGLTETSPILTFNTPSEARIGSAGRPIAGVCLRIDAPEGEAVGEILARGPSVFAGYWNRPEATHDAFTGDGWFRTGDLGTLDADGVLSVIGRTTESIVLAGGEKVMPEEVEKAYAGNPLIGEIAVLEQAGDLVALVVPDIEEVRKRGTERIADLVREELEFCARRVPSAQRLAGHAITREALPRTALGKLRRHLLADRYRRARDGEVHRTAAVPSPEDLALIENAPGREIWDWLSRRFPDHALDLDTSPQLDLGIDSLGWIGLGMEIEQRFGIRLAETRIARIVTLRDFLHETIDAAGDERPAAVTVAPRPRGRVMVAFAHVMHFLVRLGMRILFRLRIEGADRIPASGPLVIAANHASYLDPLVIAASLPSRFVRMTYFSGWTGLMFRGTVSRLFSRVANVLPVDPDRMALASIRVAREVLADGGVLVWFPEGQRSPTGQLRRLMPGIGVVLEDSSTPVMPVWIEGTFEAAPAGRMVPKLRRIGIRFGGVVSSAGLAERGRGQTSRERIVDGLGRALTALAEKDHGTRSRDQH